MDEGPDSGATYKPESRGLRDIEDKEEDSLASASVTRRTID